MEDTNGGRRNEKPKDGNRWRMRWRRIEGRRDGEEGVFQRAVMSVIKKWLGR